MAIYINCTETYITKFNSGIQRVVKKIAHLANGTPVYFDGLGFKLIKVEDLYDTKKRSNIFKRKVVLLARKYPLLKKIIKELLFLKTCMLYWKNKNEYISFDVKDILLSADIVKGRRLPLYLKKNNITTYQVVYDILPITYPLFFDKHAIKEFQETSKLWPIYSKKIFAISKKVANELQHKLKIRNVDYFYLGSDFYNEKSYNISTKFENFFLVVGTIEPRKDHLFVLKTFEEMWASGSNEKLVFIGSKGWNYECILPLIVSAAKNHPDKFLWLENVGDKELESYYQKSKAVICSSIDEGFGLPVIEALSRHKNVLCSDIDIFREIGGRHCTFFSKKSSDPNSLKKLINDELYKIDISDFKWITWEESVHILMGKIAKDIV